METEIIEVEEERRGEIEDKVMEKDEAEKRRKGNY